MNALIAKIVDRLNRRRTEQKEAALAWIEETGANWQARIDRVKEMIANNPFNPDPAEIGGLPDEEKLLQLMIDATSEAQTKGRGDDDTLQSDLTRLTNVLVELKAGRAAQLEHGTALRNAEVSLARHYEEAALLTAEGGILDRPAAKILESASSSVLVGGPAWLPRALGWPIVIPALAVLSLMLALIFTKAVCWLKPSDDVRSDSYLNDPNWPLPPGARQEFST